MIVPVIEMVLNPEDKSKGVKTISLVDKPAIESNFLFLSKENKPRYIALAEENASGKSYQQVVHGLALIPDKLILRFTEDGAPFQIYFTAETIDAIRKKFHKEQQDQNVNTQHDSKSYIKAYMFEDFIVDSKARQEDLKLKGIDAPIGSWYVKYQIEDKADFQKVLDGEFKGFSIEAEMDSLFKTQIIQQQNQEVMNIKEELKTLKAELIAMLKPEALKLEDAPSSIPAPTGATEQAPVAAASGATSGTTETKKEEYVSKAEFEALKAELETLKTAKAALEQSAVTLTEAKTKAEKEAKEASDEVIKLKSQPQATPVVEVKTDKVKLSLAEYNKLSNTQKIAYDNGMDYRF